MTKTCLKCGIDKPLEDLEKNKESTFGRRAFCKQCKNARSRNRRVEHPDIVNAYYREYHKRYKLREKVAVEAIICATCDIEKPTSEFHKSSKSRNGYKHSCKQCRNGWDREAYAEDPEKRKEYHKRRNILKRDENHSRYLEIVKDPIKKEKRLATSRVWKTRNPEKVREYGKSWRIKNPDKNAAKEAKRRAVKLKATPPWLTPEHFEEISTFFTLAQEMTKRTGIIHEVDHIIPLQGKNVCGLHVPWNLQILTKSENSKKSNKL